MSRSIGVAVAPVTGHVAHLLDLARRAGPSCFLGRCATGDRYAEMAALGLAIILVGLASAQTRGWLVPAYATATVVLIVGFSSLALPGETGALGRPSATLAIAWALAFAAAARRQRP